MTRIALRHGVSVREFLLSSGAPAEGHADLDWTADAALIAWLSYGAGVPRERLVQMTLRARFPGRGRGEFAWSRGSAFAGRHAFCPTCAHEELAVHGAPVSHCADAGLWRLACAKHGVLLDSVLDERDLAARRPPERPNPRNSYPLAWSSTPAPPFALAFDRAAKRVQSGKQAGPLWLVQTPAEFLLLSSELASLMLVQRRPSHFVFSAASVLLGDDRLSHPSHGDSLFDLHLIRTVNSYARVRAFAAAALLLLTPTGATRLNVVRWAQRHAPFSRPKLYAEAPWEVAADAWGRATLELVFERSAHWPPSIAETASTVVERRLQFIGAAPRRKRT